MATLKSFTCGVICFSGPNIIAQIRRNDGIVHQRIQLEDTQVKEQEAKDSGSENDAERSVTSTKNQILASCCSSSGKYLAVCDDLKQLYLYKFDVNWKIISRRSVARRCTALTFTQDDQYVLVADKTGDVYRFLVEDSEHSGELLLGHLSMLLDIVLAKNDRYVVTCDRDEKIRVSCYPNSYNIHSYCLKHTEYVASVIYIKNHDLLLSGGGDGKIILWNLNGEALCEVDCKTSQECFHGNKGSSKPELNDSSQTPLESSAEETDCYSVKKCVYDRKLNVLCVCFYNSCQVHIYNVKVIDGVPICDLCDVVKVSREPWDICCDSCQTLYVLQPVEGETIKVFSLVLENKMVKAVTTEQQVGDQWMSMLDIINKDWTFFKESEDIPSMYQGLMKIKMDQNMKDYLEKKQIRLSGQKIPQPPSKKVKQR